MKGPSLKLEYESAELKLVPPEPIYAADSLHWVSDPLVCRFMGMDFSDASLEREQERIREISESEDGYYWEMSLDGQMVGNASLHALAECHENYQQKAASYTIMIGDRAAMGRGIGTAVTRAVFDWGFGKGGLELIVSRVAEQNTPSMALMKKLGMWPAGTEPNTGAGREEFADWQVFEITHSAWAVVRAGAGRSPR
jgi:RimJ/RimL family protein N-acetyltransferase